MNSVVPLTAEEAAKLLKISKYTLYELIKRGEIPAQRVGRQLRIAPEALNHYLAASPSASSTASLSSSTLTPPNSSPPSGLGGSSTQTTWGVRGRTALPVLEGSSLRFAGSHEPGIELASEFLKYKANPIEMELAFTGSMEGLIALFRGEAEIAGMHLWDANTDEYNLPFAKHILAGENFVLVNFVQRIQGWIVPPGNPLELASWDDITREGLRFVNRQKGSGTRIRLDSYLQCNHITPTLIRGYTVEETTHSGVALRIANGEADAGIGVQAAAQRLGLDFIPLFKERYDLVYLEASSENPALSALLETLRSPAFQTALRRLGADTSQTGQIIAHSWN